jgi:hypothetical protein
MSLQKKYGIRENGLNARKLSNSREIRWRQRNSMNQLRHSEGSRTTSETIDDGIPRRVTIIRESNQKNRAYESSFRCGFARVRSIGEVISGSGSMLRDEPRLSTHSEDL